jgi:hypothetical protein
MFSGPPGQYHTGRVIQSSAKLIRQKTKDTMGHLTERLSKLSAIIFGISLILWPISYCLVSKISPLIPAFSVPLLGDFRCSVFNGGLLLFNSERPIPGTPGFKGDSKTHVFIDGDGQRAVRIQDWQWEFGGAMLSQWTSHGEDHEFVGMARDGDMPGIFYRHRQDTENSVSTLRVSFLDPVFIFGFIPAMRLLHARYGRTKR